MVTQKRTLWTCVFMIMLAAGLVLAQEGPGPRGPQQGFGGPGQGMPPAMGPGRQQGFGGPGQGMQPPMRQPAGPGFGRRFGGPRNGMPPRMGRMAGPGLGLRGLFRLDLTQEQRASIKAIQTEHQKTMETLRKAVQTARQALQKAVVDGNDVETIRNAATTLGQAIGDASIERVGVVKAIKAVLTKEQLAQLNAMKDQAPAPQGGPMGRRGGWRRGRGGQGRFGGGGFRMAGPPAQGPGPEAPPENLQ